MGYYVRRVVVGVDGSAGSLHALRYAVAEARTHEAAICSVLAWTPPGGEGVDRRAPIGRLWRVWSDNAERRLRTAWNEALGGVPEDLRVTMLVMCGRAGRVLVAVADHDDDLLVVGAGARGVLRRRLTPSVSRYCLAKARCQVLAVPSSELARELGRGLSGLLPRALRHRRITRALAH